MKNKYFVISLPRTGTKTLCKMADTLGLKYKHVPSIKLQELYTEFNFFADTPCYAYSHIIKLMINDNNKFIYIDRSADDWYSSFKNSGMINNFNYLINKKDLAPINALDKTSLVEVFGENSEEPHMIKMFNRHRDFCLTMTSDKLLHYSLDQGWQPLCDFLGISSFDYTKPIPHINAGTLYGKI